MTDRLDEAATESFEPSIEALKESAETLLDDTLRPLASDAEELFERVGDTIASSFERGARRGSLSVKGLVDDVLSDLSRVAAEQLIRGPLEAGIASIFGGARAGGGPVAGGLPYLVGEQGPELFVPSGAGTIERSMPSVTINVTSPAAPVGEPFPYSSAQLASRLSRTLQKALRNG